MILYCVPDFKEPTVTTAPSIGSNSLATIVCIFITKSAAITVASTHWCGFAAWPPLPIKVIEKRSVCAILAPGSTEISPAFISENRCRPNISSTSSKIPCEIICFAPFVFSSDGWKISLTRTVSSDSISFNMEAAPKSPAICPSCPQACIFPRCFDWNGRSVSSETLRPSISALSATV